MGRRTGTVVLGAVMATTLAGLLGVPPASAATNGRIAYQCFTNGGLDSDICVVDPADPTAPPINLTNDAATDEFPDWSPDGTRIVFNSDREPAFTWNIFSMLADGTEVTRLTDTTYAEGRDIQPQWSPDGSKIAFVSTRDDTGYEIYVMGAQGEIAGPEARRLTTDAAPEFGQGKNDWQITWAPSSDRIAFVSNRDPVDVDACDIYAMDVVDANGDGFGDNLERLTRENTQNCDTLAPSWSPDGSMIAFSSPRTGDWEIWVMNADGSDPVNVTQAPGSHEYDPGWSPDGTQITFTSTRTGNYDVFAMDAPGAGAQAARAALRPSSAPPDATQLTHSNGDDVAPDWGARATTITRFRLTVERLGSGRGRVTSEPAGISCGPDCAQRYGEGAIVTLRARPREGSAFARWGGDCAGVTTRRCTVTMTAARHVVARFRAL